MHIGCDALGPGWSYIFWGLGYCKCLFKLNGSKGHALIHLNVLLQKMYIEKLRKAFLFLVKFSNEVTLTMPPFTLEHFSAHFPMSDYAQHAESHTF